MTRQAEIFGSSIIAVGSFNPAIFSPDWLLRNQLIGQGDCETALSSESLIVSRQVCAYETAWFALQVLEEQFSLTSKGPLTPAFSDLAIGILSLVPHSPIRALGLNFHAHYRLGSEADYHRVGDVLAPKVIWRDLFPGDGFSAGMADLTIRIQETNERREALSKNEKRISIQPSSKLRYGVYMSYNNHNVIEASGDLLPPGEQAAGIIEADWLKTWEDATRVFDGLISAALAGTGNTN
ncbi:MAG: hypothetical protein H6R10_2778 [Rhodocyclaceae bacterium]|nr:hypothetical protein [Rhodocyclaceae bacterium]